MAQCCMCGSSRVVDQGRVGVAPASVLSDARRLDHASRVYRCDDCSHWQKFHTPADWSVISAVYSNYQGHHLSKGVEQVVFHPGLPPRSRSFHALEKCLGSLPAQGQMLDYGCGDGAVLKSASQLLKNWQLDAYDISDQYQGLIRAIPGVRDFFALKPESIPNKKYDLVVLWHTLEHVSAPTDELRALRRFLRPSGKILLQVPDVERNPFDLGVFDHVSHFTQANLISCASRAGLEVVADGYDWTHNCLTLLLGEKSGRSDVVTGGSDARVLEKLNQRIARCCSAVQSGPYLLWGSGMASLLLLGHLPHPPLFLVDEDQTREGNAVGGVAIKHPRSITSAPTVILPFPPATATTIKDRALREYPGFAAATWVE